MLGKVEEREVVITETMTFTELDQRNNIKANPERA